MRVYIARDGWEKYTGLLGTVPFTNGVSDRDLTEQEVKRIGASILIKIVDSDTQVGASVEMANGRNMSAEVVKPLLTSEETKPEPVELKYSRKDLEVIADKEGITGIREIAKEFDVKGVQISKMINDIMEAQVKQ